MKYNTEIRKENQIEYFDLNHLSCCFSRLFVGDVVALVRLVYDRFNNPTYHCSSFSFRILDFNEDGTLDLLDLKDNQVRSNIHCVSVFKKR